MKKIITILFSFLTVFSIIPSTVYADEKSNNIYEKTYTVNFSDYGESYTPDKEIEVDGEKYILKNFNITGKEQKTFEIEESNLPDKSYTSPESIINPNNTAQSGNLLTTYFSENRQNKRNEIAAEKVKYTKVQVNYDVPSTHQTEYKDEKTNTVIPAELKLTETEKSNPYWINIDGFKGTVTGYDALYYNLDNSNSQIPKNENYPNYKGYEKTILKSLGLNDNYRITGSSWSGNTYYNAQGILCRDCVYNAQLQVCDIIATYSSSIELPDIVTYTATSVYEDENNSTYTILARYEKVQPEEKEINPVVIALGVILGILVISGLIAAILIHLSKKKEREKEINV